MKKTVFPVILAAVFLVGFASCASSGDSARGEGAAINSKTVEMINSNCYEVVAKKPTSDSLSYEAEPHWNLLDFKERNDPYIGLGTAFAVSRTELVTAAHVLGLDRDSLVFTERYIRQKIRTGSGKTEEIVREIDTVVSYSSNRDYVVFTVKDFECSSWFEIADEAQFNKTIYTAGNAYSEGIVIREGRLLDTLPEPENGEWEYLKSSIATNPGNSGGPLLDSSFKVIGIVLSKKDDFCYALGMKDIIPGKAILYSRLNFGFSIFTKKLTRTTVKETRLPMPYRDLVQWLSLRNREIVSEGMAALLEENRDDLFPNGPNSLKVLNSIYVSAFPQLCLQGSNDNSWFMSNIQANSSDIGENGKVYWGEPYENSGIFFLDIEHPDSVSPAEYTDNPRILMDHIVKGIKYERKVTSSDIGVRITSMGDPLYTGSHVDRWGRRWDIHQWLMEYADQMIIIFSTPTPQGVSLLYKDISSADRTDWMWDMKHLTDFVGISYMGTLEEWKAFFARPDFLSGPLKQMSFSYEKGKTAALNAGDFSLKAFDPVVPIEDKTLMLINLNFLLKNDEPVWDVRRAILAEGSDPNNFAYIMRMTEPDPRLPKTFHDEWQNYALERKHPYSGVPYVEEGNSKAGKLHGTFILDSVTMPKNKNLFFIFLGKSGLVSNDTMTGALRSLEENIAIR